ncbi:MAG: tetratricopeptide repeat protein [Chloroflexi bacterium]|nr:tetratricopeptide repeat protein [Chloroflexota bacterium]
MFDRPSLILAQFPGRRFNKLAGHQYDVLLDLAASFYFRNDLIKAQASYTLALITSKRNSIAWSNLGVLLKEQGHPGEAEGAYRRALEADPKLAQAWSNLGNLLRELDRYAEARDALEQAVLYRPVQAIYHANLGLVYQKLGEQEKANRELMEAQRLCENESAYNRACIAALCSDLEMAFRLLEESIVNHEISLEWVRQDPDWKDLRDAPRFIKLMGG